MKAIETITADYVARVVYNIDTNKYVVVVLGFTPVLSFSIDPDTPDEWLDSLIRVAITARKAMDQEQRAIDQYAQLN